MTCTCMFLLTVLEEIPSACESVNCNSGVCEVDDDTSVCRCFDGYEGDFCDGKDIDDKHLILFSVVSCQYSIECAIQRQSCAKLLCSSVKVIGLICESSDQARC